MATTLRGSLTRSGFSVLKLKPNTFIFQKNPSRFFASSEIKGETSKQLVNKTIGEFLVETANKYEHKDAFKPFHEDYRWTYLELKKWIDGTSTGLHSLRYKSGQSMIVDLKDNTEHVVVNLALSRMGYQALNIPFSPASTLGDAILFAQPLGFLYSPAEEATNEESIHQLLPEIQGWSEEDLGVFKSWKYPSLRWVVNTGYIARPGQVTLKDIVRTVKPDPVAPQQSTVLPSHFAAGYLSPPSSSSSSTWQADYYSHSSVLNLAHFLSEAIGLGGTDRVCTLLPLHSPIAQPIGILSPLSKGAFIVLHASTFIPEKAVQAISVEKCNYLFALPSQISAISKHIQSSASSANKHSRSGKNKFDVSSVQRILVVHQSEDPVSSATIEEARSSFPNVKQIFVYSDGIVFNALDDFRGKPLPNVEVKLVGEGSGKAVSVGTVGNIQSKGYHNRSQRVTCDEDLGALRKSPTFKAYTWSPKLKTDKSEWITSSTTARLDSSGVLRLNL